MKHLTIILKQSGDLITAVGQALDIAKAINETLYLDLSCGKTISIHPESYVLDLIEIATKTQELTTLKPNN